jgi:dTDP-N-acetylfucosamine:lipid II N-acetylfucosaminyltransferase
MKLLHLVVDDKFTTAARENFDKHEAVDNHWLVVASGDLTYLNSSEFEKVSVRESLLPSFKCRLKNYDFVIVHSLSSEHCDIININPHNYLWIGMGYDYYEYIEKNIYLPFSKKVQRLPVVKKKIESLLVQYLKLDWAMPEKRRKAINSISFFAPVLPDEFSGVKRIFTHLEYIEWNYGASATLLTDELLLKREAGSILIGNSSDPSNNHFEVIELLSSLGVSDNDIILPLSYGSVRYKKKLLNSIKGFDNLTFKVLDGFMPKESYFDLLTDCGVVIMNHVRQQAGANINVMLFMGAKVFLNSKSPFYEYYKSQGAVIYTVDDIKNDPSILKGRLDKESIKTNRDIVNYFANQGNINRKTASLIMTLKSSKQA